MKQKPVHFSPDQIAELKDHYGQVQAVDPESPALAQCRQFVQGLELSLLEQLVSERVPWLRAIAASEILRRKAKL